MYFANSAFSANETMQKLMSAMSDMAAQQAKLATAPEMPWTLEWYEGPVPMPYVALKPMSPEATRRAFHSMAEINLRRWEMTADMLSAMPDWMKTPYTVPGEFWSTLFDGLNEKYAESPQETPQATEPTRSEPVAPKPPKTASGETSNQPLFMEKPMGTADDLTAIKGIGKKISKVLNELGVFHFSQIADWSPDHVAWIDDHLTFKGRIQREQWVKQAKKLRA